MVVNETSALVAGIKGTIDLAKGLKSAYDSHTIAQAQSDLLDRLLALQTDALMLLQKQSDLLAERDQLTEAIDNLNNWAELEKRHHIEEVHPQIYVYVANVPNPSLKNQPWYCANCFTDKKLSVLQSTESSHENYKDLLCHKCKASVSFIIDRGSSPSAKFVTPPDRFPGF